MEKFCEASGFKRQNIRLKFNGREVLETDTPNSIGMNEGDYIDIVNRFFWFYKQFRTIYI